MSKSKTLKGTLRAIRKLIEAGWTKGVLVRDKYGHRIEDVNSPSAAKFCLLGAIEKVDGGYKTVAIVALATELFSIGWLSIPAFNDAKSTRKEDVLSVIDRVILHAESVVKADVLTVLDTVIAKVKS